MIITTVGVVVAAATVVVDGGGVAAATVVVVVAAAAAAAVAGVSAHSRVARSTQRVARFVESVDCDAELTSHDSIDGIALCRFDPDSIPGL